MIILILIRSPNYSCLQVYDAYIYYMYGYGFTDLLICILIMPSYHIYNFRFHVSYCSGQSICI